MPLINRYLFRQFSQLVFAVLTVLFLISVGGFLTDLIAEISRGKVPAGLMLQLLVLRLPRFISFVLPLALFIGLMMGIARLYADSEMAVLASVGVSSQQLLKPVLWVVRFGTRTLRGTARQVRHPVRHRTQPRRPAVQESVRAA